MWRWPWPAIGVGTFGASGGAPPPPPPPPTAVTGTNDPRPVVPNLKSYRSQAATVGQVVTDLNRLAQQASLAATENPHWVMRYLRQIVVLSTSGLVTDTVVPMLFADSLLSHVTVRVTVPVTGATSLDIGDATTGNRFVSGFTNLAAGDAVVGLNHWNLGKASQTADAALRVTANLAATAGALEIVTWFWRFTVPDLPVGQVVAPPPPPPGGTSGGLRIFAGRWMVG